MEYQDSSTFPRPYLWRHERPVKLETFAKASNRLFSGHLRARSLTRCKQRREAIGRIGYALQVWIAQRPGIGDGDIVVHFAILQR